MRVGFAASVLTAAAALVAGQAVAQYDRDGRYVPSPLGIPADPYARPIPNYSGKPGDAKGTPIWPRGTPSDPAPAMLPRPPAPTSRLPGALPQPVTVLPLTIEQCDEGWSSALKIPRVEFNRRCRVIKLRK